MRRSALRQAIAAAVAAVDVSAYQRRSGGTETLRHVKLGTDTGFQFDHLTFAVELGDTTPAERRRSEVMAITAVDVTVTHAVRQALDGSVWEAADKCSDLAEDIAAALSTDLSGATVRVSALRSLGPTTDSLAWGMVVSLSVVHPFDL